MHNQCTINAHTQQSMDNPWTANEKPMSNQWTVNAQSINNQWTVNEDSVNNPCTINEPPMHNQGTVNEQPLHNQWTTNERSMNNFNASVRLLTPRVQKLPGSTWACVHSTRVHQNCFSVTHHRGSRQFLYVLFCAIRQLCSQCFIRHPSMLDSTR